MDLRKENVNTENVTLSCYKVIRSTESFSPLLPKKIELKKYKKSVDQLENTQNRSVKEVIPYLVNIIYDDEIKALEG